jgi:hypothetical protein
MRGTIRKTPASVAVFVKAEVRVWYHVCVRPRLTGTLTTEGEWQEVRATMAQKRHRKIRLQGGSTAYLRNTSQLPDELAVRMVRHALANVNVGRCAVHLKQKHDGWNLGRAYFMVPYDSSAPPEAQHLIVARYGGDVARCVNTLAHEGAHVEDYREGRYAKLKKQRQGERSARRLGGKRQATWLAKHGDWLGPGTRNFAALTP